MTNEELFEDLKQFITATVSQQTAELAERIDAVEAKMATKDDLAHIEQGLNKRIDQLDQKLDQVHDAIADTLTPTTEALDATAQGHEKAPHAA